MRVYTRSWAEKPSNRLSESQWNNLIQDIAARIGSCFRRHGEVLARLDDCSFAIILPHADIDMLPANGQKGIKSSRPGRYLALQSVKSNHVERWHCSMAKPTWTLKTY